VAAQKGNAGGKPTEDRRARFAEEYAKDRNATQAAIRSGYAKASAHVTGCRLLKDAKVLALVERVHMNASAITGITVERIQQELGRIAFADPRKLYRVDGSMKAPHEWDDDTAAGIASLESDQTHRAATYEERGPQLEMPGMAPKAEEVLVRVVTQKVKRWDKNRALDMLMACMGMHKTNKPAEGGGLSLTIKTSQGAKLR
jgi:phage terminase small subunit